MTWAPGCGNRYRLPDGTLVCEVCLPPPRKESIDTDKIFYKNWQPPKIEHLLQSLISPELLSVHLPNGIEPITLEVTVDVVDGVRKIQVTDSREQEDRSDN